MTDTVKHILEEVENLSVKDRALLAHNILTSIDSEKEEDIEEAWAALAEQRYEELISGEAKAISWRMLKKKFEVRL